MPLVQDNNSQKKIDVLEKRRSQFELTEQQSGPLGNFPNVLLKRAD